MAGNSLGGSGPGLHVDHARRVGAVLHKTEKGYAACLQYRLVEVAPSCEMHFFCSRTAALAVKRAIAVGPRAASALTSPQKTVSPRSPFQRRKRPVWNSSCLCRDVALLILIWWPRLVAQHIAPRPPSAGLCIRRARCPRFPNVAAPRPQPPRYRRCGAYQTPHVATARRICQPKTDRAGVK